MRDSFAIRPPPGYVNVKKCRRRIIAEPTSYEKIIIALTHLLNAADAVDTEVRGEKSRATSQRGFLSEPLHPRRPRR
jgi:hypothetical protein